MSSNAQTPQQKYREKNKEKLKQYQDRWRVNNRDKWNEYYRTYYTFNKMKIRDDVKTRRVMKKLKLLRVSPLAAFKKDLIDETTYNKIKKITTKTRPRTVTAQ